MTQPIRHDCNKSVVCCDRQAALEALESVLEAFQEEDHFEAVCQPLLATPHQHVQAAASAPAQV